MQSSLSKPSPIEGTCPVGLRLVDRLELSSLSIRAERVTSHDTIGEHHERACLSCRYVLVESERFGLSTASLQSWSSTN